MTKCFPLLPPHPVVLDKRPLSGFLLLFRVTLGNQVDGVKLIDPDIVRAFKKVYPDGNCMKPSAKWTAALTTVDGRFICVSTKESGS